MSLLLIIILGGAVCAFLASIFKVSYMSILKSAISFLLILAFDYFPYSSVENLSVRSQHDIINVIIEQGYIYDPSHMRLGVIDAINEEKSKNSELGYVWAEICSDWQLANTHAEIYNNFDWSYFDNTDAFVVLGLQLNDDGTMKQELIDRLELALQAHQNTPDSIIVCTGGHTARNNSRVSEGSSMRSWLIEHGANPDVIVAETESATTTENAWNTYPIFSHNYPYVKYVHLISSAYHLNRAYIDFDACYKLLNYEIGNHDIEIGDLYGIDTNEPNYENAALQAKDLQQINDDYFNRFGEK